MARIKVCRVSFSDPIYSVRSCVVRAQDVGRASAIIALLGRRVLKVTTPVAEPVQPNVS